MYIAEGLYLYNTKSGSLTKKDAENYCKEQNAAIPDKTQYTKIINKMGAKTAGLSWLSSDTNESDEMPTWCVAKDNKVKELSDKNESYCSPECPIWCQNGDLDADECSCDSVCPVKIYTKLYVIRENNNNSSQSSKLYNQLMNQSGSTRTSFSDKFYKVAEKLNDIDKNRLFTNYIAYVIGTVEDADGNIEEAKVVASFTPHTWWKFTTFVESDFTEENELISTLQNTKNYDKVNPYFHDIECKYTDNNGRNKTTKKLDECKQNNGILTSVTCKTESKVKFYSGSSGNEYLSGFKYNPKFLSCRERIEGTTVDSDSVSTNFTQMNDSITTDCSVLCAEDKLPNDYECISSCENLIMTQNIFANCRNGAYVGELCSGGAIKLHPNENCPSIYVDETFRRYGSPLILDLLGDGLKFTSPENGVMFDLNADGITERVAWTDYQTEFDDAFLWYDKNNDGKIFNGKELFGDQNGEENGFYELAKYDKNKDNVINKDDAIYEKLRLWVDFNKNAQIDEGEVKTLPEAGVVEIPLEFNIVRDKHGNIKTDEHGNITGFVGAFKQVVETIINGVNTLIEKIGTMIDVFFASL